MNRKDETLRNQAALLRAHNTTLDPDEPVIPTRADRDFAAASTCALVLVGGKLEADLDIRGGD